LGQLRAMPELRGESESARRLAALRDKQAQAILLCGWDGAWWRHGCDKDDNAIGSAACAHGKL